MVSPKDNFPWFSAYQKHADRENRFFKPSCTALLWNERLRTRPQQLPYYTGTELGTRIRATNPCHTRGSSSSVLSCNERLLQMMCRGARFQVVLNFVKTEAEVNASERNVVCSRHQSFPSAGDCNSFFLVGRVQLYALWNIHIASRRACHTWFDIDRHQRHLTWALETHESRST